MIIDGKKISEEILLDLKEKIKESGVIPSLAVILIGDNTASESYVMRKKKAGEAIGARIEIYHLDSKVSFEEVEKLIDKLNKDSQIHGIILQLPIPEYLDEKRILNLINPDKDVDGLVNGSPFSPATALGIIELLKRSNVTLEGMEAVVVGRSALVGRPTAELLLKENATVTICHSKSKSLSKHTREADLLVVAVGKPNFIKAGMVKDGAIVVDVGINRSEGTTISGLVGDVDFDEVKKKASLITPVPGGVGPMTVAMLMQNLFKASLKE